MSFPVHVYGSYGDEKVAQSTKIGSLPLGTRMILPDGRVYAHGRAASGTALGAGLMSSQAAVAGGSTHTSLDVPLAATAGNSVINATLGATTAVTKDQFADGYIFVNDGTGYGEGNIYKVKGNNSGAVSTTVEFQLEDNDTVQVALAAGTTLGGIRRNEFDHVIARAAATASVGIPTGVANIAVSAGFYCWLQRRGACNVLAAATLSQVGFMIASNTVTAGAVSKCMPTAADTTLDPVQYPLGWVMVPVLTGGDYELDYLTLD